MGIGAAGGENRAADAAKTAISSPLLEESVEGATGILLNITGGRDLGLFEVNEAAEIVQGAADANANIIFGSVIDESLGDEVRVTVIATGFDHGRARPRQAREETRDSAPRDRDRSPRVERVVARDPRRRDRHPALPALSAARVTVPVPARGSRVGRDGRRTAAVRRWRGWSPVPWRLRSITMPWSPHGRPDAADDHRTSSAELPLDAARAEHRGRPRDELLTDFLVRPYPTKVDAGQLAVAARARRAAGRAAAPRASLSGSPAAACPDRGPSRASRAARTTDQRGSTSSASAAPPRAASRAQR